MITVRRFCLFLLLLTGAFCCVFFEGYVVGVVVFKGLPQFLQGAKAWLIPLLPLLVNTLLLTVVTLLLSLPCAIGCGIWLFWYAKEGFLKRLILGVLEALAGIPSVVYGLFGFLMFGSLLKLRYSLLSGALTMAILVLPVAVRGTQTALQAVNGRFIEGALALGATPTQLILTMLIPCAKNGLYSSALLCCARIAGESAPLLLTAGTGARLPTGGLFSHLFNSGATLAVGVYQHILEGEITEAFTISLGILLMVCCLNLAIGSLEKRK